MMLAPLVVICIVKIMAMSVHVIGTMDLRRSRVTSSHRIVGRSECQLGTYAGQPRLIVQTRWCPHLGRCLFLVLQ